MRNLTYVSLLIFFGLSNIYSQNISNLKSQLSYCKQESAKFEKDLNSYKGYLEIQGSQIRELKETIQNQESEIRNLKAKNEQLEGVSITILELGIKYEEQGKTEEAIEVYKLLMRNFPHSMDAISARMKIIEMKRKQKEELEASKK